MNLFKTENINPEILKSSLAGSTNSNLLETKNSIRLSSGKSALLYESVDYDISYSYSGKHYCNIFVKCKFWETGEMGKDETAGTCWIRKQISYRNESLKNYKRERKKRNKMIILFGLKNRLILSKTELKAINFNIR